MEWKSTNTKLPVADQKRLDALRERLDQDAVFELGYPVAFDINHARLAPFLNYNINNIGDPFQRGHYRLNTHEFEREVLEFFAQAARAPADDWWGYVTNGSTEGNLYGLYLARESLPNGIVYFSQDSHYSVRKNLHFLNMRHIMIRSQPHGEIDYEDLRESIKIRRDAQPIVFANVGTTMKEARDNVGIIRSILDELAIEQSYLHSDAALCGAYCAYLEPRPSWDFADGADSISISGHKFLGAPVPCGIALARRRNVERIAHAVAYIGTVDTTVTGSRNGLSPLMLWHTIRSLGKAGLRERVEHALQMAAYTETTFRQVGIDAWRNPQALTVVFPSPAQSVCTKWQLASNEGISHVICMPHVTRAQIDKLRDDIVVAAGKNK
ncbi:MAG: histidine decarboxylase [Gammaproteobacteria bacterium]|nr:histidine decarboxylase [Gammaproteobacteria bacterium]